MKKLIWLISPFLILSNSELNKTSAINFPNVFQEQQTVNKNEIIASCFISSALNYKNFIGHYSLVVGTAWTATDTVMCVQNKLARGQEIDFIKETWEDLLINNSLTLFVSPVTRRARGIVNRFPRFLRRNYVYMIVGRTVKYKLFSYRNYWREWFRKN